MFKSDSCHSQVKISNFRRCVKFLKSAIPGCYQQKALDIRDPPSLPKHVLLYRARGVEDVVVEDNADLDDSEDDESDEVDKNGGEDLDQVMTSHGDL